MVEQVVRWSIFPLTDQYGSNNYEAAVCDMLVDSSEEIVNGVIRLRMIAKTEEAKVSSLYLLVFHSLHILLLEITFV